MNQIVQMFQDSNARLKSIMNGKYNRDQMQDANREFSDQIKLINAVIQAYGVASKNKRASISMEKMNLLDDHTAIDLGLPAAGDTVKCPDKDTLITREDCLDYSGDNDDCRGCEHFAKSRELLLDQTK
jgi:hypothetical protein